MSVPFVGTAADLRRSVTSWRARGETIALVPTMGALHAGHLALVARARAQGARVVVSIFVNPTQFGPSEDFGRYPRTFEADLAALDGRADLVFAPSVEEMYPPGEATRVQVGGPAQAGLEDAVRPGHFEGVATVVAKLLIQCGPDVAIFGEKDWQQLAVIGQMARDLALPARIEGVPTVREPDGLALSSRNRYLSSDERARAPVLYAAIAQAAGAIAAGAPIEASLEEARRAVRAAGMSIDYIEAREARTLAPPAPGSSLRILAAARLGATRLIDNVPVA